MLALLHEGQSVDSLTPGQQGEVVLDRTPFYAEAGGQIGDSGTLRGPPATLFEVEDTQKRGAVLELAGHQYGLMANADLSGLAITLH